MLLPFYIINLIGYQNTFIKGLIACFKPCVEVPILGTEIWACFSLLLSFYEFQGVLALLVALVPLAFCWPRTEDEKKCSTDAFQKALGESESTRDDLVFMAEFSRFMNFKAPTLLQVSKRCRTPSLMFQICMKICFCF